MEELERLAMREPPEFDWQSYYEEFQTYLPPEDKIAFWKCSINGCGALNAVVTGEKPRCATCNARTLYPDFISTPVL